MRRDKDKATDDGYTTIRLRTATIKKLKRLHARRAKLFEQKGMKLFLSGTVEVALELLERELNREGE